MGLKPVPLASGVPQERSLEDIARPVVSLIDPTVFSNSIMAVDGLPQWVWIVARNPRRVDLSVVLPDMTGTGFSPESCSGFGE